MRWDHGEAHRTSKILVMFQFLSQVDISMDILITLLNCTYIFCMLVYTNIIKSFKFCFLYHLLGIFLLPGNTQSKSTHLRTWVKVVVLGSCLATDSNAHTHNPYLSPQLLSTISRDILHPFKVLITLALLWASKWTPRTEHKAPHVTWYC